MATDATGTELQRLVERALAEDVGTGDVTSEATVDAAARARARILQKQPGVVFGLDAAAEVFRQTGAGELERRLEEGRWTRRRARGGGRGRGPRARRCSPPSAPRSTCSATSRGLRR